MSDIKSDRAIIHGQGLRWKTTVWVTLLCILSLGNLALAVRDRPHLDTTLGFNVLLSDNDTLLRGVSLSWDGGDPYGSQVKVMPSQASLNAMATDYGLNTAHLYLEGDSIRTPQDPQSPPNTNPIGYNATDCDTLVQRCANANLYLIITIGCNGYNGTMDLSWSQDFWNFYGPRYKDETHVIYEAHNEPAPNSLWNWKTSDWNNQIALYNTIRAAAPDTFILLGSFMGFVGASNINSQYDPRNRANYLAANGVDWSNAGFAHHGYESLSGIETAISLMETSTAYPALLCTEFWPGDTIGQGYNSMYESHFNGWMQFQWLGANNWDLLSLKSKIDAAGTIWTPDNPACTWPAKGTLNIPADGTNIGLFSESELFYLTADPANGNDLVAETEDYTAAGTDTFVIEHIGPRRVSLKAANGKYVRSTGTTDSLTASASTAGKNEQFEWIRLPNDDVVLRAYGGGGHLASVNANNGRVYPNTDKAFHLAANFVDVDAPAGPLPPLPALTGNPYSGTPLPIGPGTTVIEAENFDDGGESVGYHDDDQGNQGGRYRSTDVDIESCSEGGYNVGWIETEERLNYTVNVTTAPGDYALTARVATQNSGGTFQVHFNRMNKTGNIAVPNTGWWQTWNNTATKVITLDSGPQIMTFVRTGTADFNLNRFTLTYLGGNGDTDLDGDIDLRDFAQLASYWQQTGCGSCGGADLTGDGNVWLEDLMWFCDNWMGGL